MVTLRNSALLCWWGAFLFTVKGAPIADQPVDTLNVKDIPSLSYAISNNRQQRDVTPCFSTLKGYGLCDDYLFTFGRIFNFRPDLMYGIPQFTDRDKVTNQLPVSSLLYQFPYDSTYTTPKKAFVHPYVIPQSIVADQFIVIIIPSTKEPADVSQVQQSSSNPLISTVSKSPLVSPSNLKEFLSLLETVSQAMNGLSQNVSEALIEDEDLERKVKKAEALPANGSDYSFSSFYKLKDFLQRIKKLAENVTYVTSTLIELLKTYNIWQLSDENIKILGREKEKREPIFQEETNSKTHDEPANEAIKSGQHISGISNGDEFERITSKIDKLEKDVKTIADAVHALGKAKGSVPEKPSSSATGVAIFELALKKTVNIAEELKNVLDSIENVRIHVHNGLKKVLQNKDNITLTGSGEVKEDSMKDQTNVTVSDNTGSEDILKYLRRGKRDENRMRDEHFAGASDKVDVSEEDKLDNDSVHEIIKKIEKFLEGVYGEGFEKAMTNMMATNIFKEGVQKREVTGNVVKVRKNDLYDIMEKAFKSRSFDESVVDTYMAKASQLVRSGVEPFDILVDTLSNLLLFAIEGIQESRVKVSDKNFKNDELYKLVEGAFEANTTDWNEAYGKKIDDMQREGIDPLRLSIDVLGDLYFIMYDKMQGKHRDSMDKDAIMSKGYNLYLFAISRIKF